jgi:hypothetical protein
MKVQKMTLNRTSTTMNGGTKISHPPPARLHNLHDEGKKQQCGNPANCCNTEPNEGKQINVSGVCDSICHLTAYENSH